MIYLLELSQGLRTRIMQRSAIAILSAMFATLISAKSYAQEVVIVKEQPPVPKVEVIESPPSPGLHWISGHWKWKDNNFVWVKGRWSKPPIPTALWEPDYWGWRPSGWVYRPGRWLY